MLYHDLGSARKNVGTKINPHSHCIGSCSGLDFLLLVLTFAGYAAGVCTVGNQQSPINIPIAEHFSENKGDGSSGEQPKGEKVGDIKFEYSQKLKGVGDLNFHFEQELEKSGDVKFKYEQKVEKFGNFKFGFEQKFKQKPNRFGDIKFKYDKQTDAVVKNPGHGTMQVSTWTYNLRCRTTQQGMSKSIPV